MEITIAVVSPLAHILYNVTLMRTTEFSASQIQKWGNMDTHAMWYFFNQNYIILKSSFLEISGENQRFLKSFILFYLFIL